MWSCRSHMMIACVKYFAFQSFNLSISFAHSSSSRSFSVQLRIQKNAQKIENEKRTNNHLHSHIIREFSISFSPLTVCAFFSGFYFHSYNFSFCIHFSLVYHDCVCILVKYCYLNEYEEKKKYTQWTIGCARAQIHTRGRSFAALRPVSVLFVWNRFIGYFICSFYVRT